MVQCLIQSLSFLLFPELLSTVREDRSTLLYLVNFLPVLSFHCRIHSVIVKVNHLQTPLVQLPLQSSDSHCIISIVYSLPLSLESFHISQWHQSVIFTLGWVQDYRRSIRDCVSTVTLIHTSEYTCVVLCVNLQTDEVHILHEPFLKLLHLELPSCIHLQEDFIELHFAQFLTHCSKYLFNFLHCNLLTFLHLWLFYLSQDSFHKVPLSLQFLVHPFNTVMVLYLSLSLKYLFIVCLFNVLDSLFVKLLQIHDVRRILYPLCLIHFHLNHYLFSSSLQRSSIDQ